ncbi:MAG: hypothetical protein GX167_05865 [Firmicutes bacterium]|nr:hypothetical protein [Bacillota bacterium]
MTHYVRQEWKAFAEGRTDEKKRCKMEEHLLACDGCLNEYLTCIAPEQESLFGSRISPQFTAQVMQKINAYAAQKKKESAKKHLLFYYAATACLTLWLTSAGIFRHLAETIPEIPGIKENRLTFPATREQRLFRFGWSDRLMDSTLHLLDAITPDEEVRE